MAAICLSLTFIVVETGRSRRRGEQILCWTDPQGAAVWAELGSSAQSSGAAVLQICRSTTRSGTQLPRLRDEVNQPSI